MENKYRFLLTGILACLFFISTAQVATLNPAFPTAEDQVTVTFDATEGTGGLAGFTGDVYAHTGVLTSESNNNSDWKYVKTAWGENTEETKLTNVGTDLYEIVIGPSIREYYGVPEGEEITHITFVFRSADTSLEGKDDGGSDILLEILTEGFAVSLNSPTQASLLVDTNEEIEIDASASEEANFTLTVGGEPVDTKTNATTYNYTHTVTETSGSFDIVLSTMSVAGNETVEETVTYTLRTATTVETRPVGIIAGINYHDSDDTKVTLCLQAPNKNSVYLVGDFNEWRIGADYQMKQDGEFFWLEIDELTAGTEYAYQYVVDETIFIADPYSDKILDANDRFIPDEIYPNLKQYPNGASNSVSFYNTASVFQTAQEDYPWTVNDFNRPDQEELIIYELLVRDFFGNGQESYDNLIDTLSYIKSLGVNAIELMPITEFSGNDSWGYNPTFMFAPDKAYGTKNDLKAFIDTAHGLGMAVILDVVLNQQEQPSPLVLLDFNLSTSKVSPTNPYFNVDATHPFNVFFDMNHESSYTQHFVDTVNHYWINEYRFDGYRFDLSKGFTQTNYGSNVGAWSGYDQGRIDLLKRMADEIWSYSPDTYVILEHFADNSEETELANYGMMLWGNLHGAYKQNILGFSQNSDISWIYHGTRGWDNAHAVGYFESHDEERQMYDALEFGSENANYSVKDEATAMERIQAAAAMFFTIPGPKMFWQFGELGYDVSINDNGRTGQKPTPWDDSEGLDYYNNSDRSLLRQYFSALIELRTTYDVFEEGEAFIRNGSSLGKQITIENPAGNDNPTTADEMNVVVVANFDITTNSVASIFPHTGTWYNFFEGSAQEIGALSTSIDLGPGEFVILTDVQLGKPAIITGLDELHESVKVYPNPAKDFIEVEIANEEPLYYFIYSLSGQLSKKGKFDGTNRIEVNELASGIHVIELITRKGDRFFQRIIKE